MSLVHLVSHRRHFLERRGLHDLQVRSVDMPWYWLRTATMTGTMCLRCGVDGLAESQRAGRLQGVLELHGYLTSGLLLRQDAEARSLSIWISCSIKTSSRLCTLKKKRKSRVLDEHRLGRDTFTALTTLFTMSSTYTSRTPDGGQR